MPEVGVGGLRSPQNLFKERKIWFGRTDKNVWRWAEAARQDICDTNDNKHIKKF